MGPCYNLVSSGPSEKNGYACWSRDAELPRPGIARRELEITRIGSRFFYALAALGRTWVLA